MIRDYVTFEKNALKKAWVKLTPFGGANTVTGSRWLVSAMVGHREFNYLLDCGLFTEKGFDKYNRNLSKIIDKIDAVFLTHAHVDHTGGVPYLYSCGYRGPVYATKATRILSRIVLPDSARIQESDAECLTRKLGITSKELVSIAGLDPLYTESDAINVMHQFVDVERGVQININDCLTVEYFDAGHMLGSSSILFTLNNGRETVRILFSGDIGQDNTILKRRIDSIKKDVDFVIMESTYAGRFHNEKEESWDEVRKIVAKTIRNSGNVIFPVFAIGRAQEMLSLYYNDMIYGNDEISELFRKTPVYLDSTMAVQATREFVNFPGEFKDSVTKLMEYKDNNPFNFPLLTMIDDAETSKKLTQLKNNYVVFSAAGMCNAGRVLFHLEKDISNPNSAIIFTGFQAEGTLGRKIVDGATEVKIRGESYPVRAKIKSVNAFSAHVDQDGLIEWLSSIEPGYTLFLAHGEPEAQSELKETLIERKKSREKIELSTYGKIYHLSKGGEYEVSTFSIETGRLPVKYEKTLTGTKGTQILIEKIRDLMDDCDDDTYDTEIRKLASKLEREMSVLRYKAQRRKQTKPNRARRMINR